MKRIIVLSSVLMMTLVVLADNTPKSISLTADQQGLVVSNNNFAFNLFRKARKDENMILSPLSITYALGMLNNGAAGETLQQINTVLGFGDAGADAINDFCRKMLSEAPVLDELTKHLYSRR
jgi:serpin B